MKIIVVIPDRGDRPKFIEQCNKMIAYQTVRPDLCVHVTFESESQKCDITSRYRFGIEKAKSLNANLIFLMENDDYYAPNYIEVMLKEYMKAGSPDLFGIGVSTYYHIGERKYFDMVHKSRSCAMNTVIKASAKINYPADFDPYFDAYLWLHDKNKHLSRATFVPEQKICLGIKHGVGKTGGEHHKTRMERYNCSDSDGAYLSDIVKDESILNFYLGFKK